MLFFGDPNNKELSEKLGKRLSASVYYPQITVFSDGERRVLIKEKVLEEKIIVLKSLGTPVDSNILEFAFTIDALKRSGAKEVTGIVSYLGYSRGDHVFKSGDAVPLEVVINIIQGAGLDKIVIIDPHSIKTSDIFNIPVTTLSSIPLFADKIKQMNFDMGKVSLVSPDMGGIRRVKELCELLTCESITVINKDRDYDTGKIKVVEATGEVGEISIMVDDIISTGGTIVQAANYLKAHGAKRTFVFATHAVFAPVAPKKLQNSNLEKVFITDTIELSEERKFEKLEVLSLDGLISEALI